MAQEQGYQARVMPQAGAPLPQASPETFGAGIGRALEGIGATVHETKLRSYQLDRKEQAEREAADFAAKFAAQRQANDANMLTLREHSDPGGAGHSERAQMMLYGQREALLDGITEDSVRRQAGAQFDEYQARQLTEENTWEHGQAALKKVGDTRAALEISRNRVYQDPSTYAQEVAQGEATLAGLEGQLEPDKLDALRREHFDQGLAIAVNQGLQNSNPRLGLAMLDAGTFNTKLTQPQTDALRGGYLTEIRRQDALAAQGVAHEKSALMEEKATILADQARGIDVGARAAALAPKLAKVGDDSGASQMAGAVENSQYAKAFNGMTPLQRQEEERAILAVPAEKRTTAQQTGLKWLQEHKAQLDGAFNSDRVGWAMTNAPDNAKPPSLDGAGGLAARADWWATARRDYGPDTDLFSKNEAAEISARLTENAAGYRAVSSELAGLPPLAGQQAAKQVAPNDKYFGQIIALPSVYRSHALDGRDFRKDPASAKLLELKTDTEKTRVAQLTTGLRNALEGVPAAQQNAIIEIARDLFADHVRRGDPPTSNLWALSQSMALGGVGMGKDQRGGLGSWNNKSFLVPDGRTAQEFTDHVFGFIAKDPKSGPLNPDGSPANIRNARPVPVGKDPQGRTMYEFHIGNKALLGRGADGKITSPWRYHIGPPPYWRTP